MSTSMSTAMAVTARGSTSVMTVKDKTVLTTLPVVDSTASSVPANMSSIGVKTVHYIQGRNSKGDMTCYAYS